MTEIKPYLINGISAWSYYDSKSKLVAGKIDKDGDNE